MEYIEHFRFYNDATRYQSHSHMSCEIICVTEGSVLITSGKRDYRVNQGQVCLIPVGVPHSTEKNDRPYKRWLMFINPWKFGRIYYSAEIQGMLLGVLCKRPAVADVTDFGKSIIKTVESELSSPKPYGRDIAAGQLIYLLSVIARENVIRNNRSLPEGLKTVMQVQMYIQENCAQPLKMEQVAEKFFTNKFYLTHIFTEYTGSSPKRFQMICRLSMAEQLLSDSSLTLADISERCGFISPGDMSKRFREEYGVTPSGYRKNKSESVVLRKWE